VDYYLMTVIGNPVDSTIAAATRIIHSGVVEETPGRATLRRARRGILPIYASRMDDAWRERPERRRYIRDHPPSSYLRRIWVDCLVYAAAHLGPPGAAHGRRPGGGRY
jgi:aminocarboxymuconate-semialdehyde decarboxylase